MEDKIGGCVAKAIANFFNWNANIKKTYPRERFTIFLRLHDWMWGLPF